MAAILRTSRYAGLYLCLTLIALVFIGPYLLTFFAAFTLFLVLLLRVLVESFVPERRG